MEQCSCTTNSCDWCKHKEKIQEQAIHYCQTDKYPTGYSGFVAGAKQFYADGIAEGRRLEKERIVEMLREAFSSAKAKLIVEYIEQEGIIDYIENNGTK